MATSCNNAVQAEMVPQKHPYEWHRYLPTPYAPRIPGIYALVNSRNNKVYIGSAANLRHRWAEHRHDLWRNRHNPYFLKAFRKEPNAFYVEVIEELPDADKAKRLQREQFWIDFYKSYIPENGYNLCRLAHSCQGIKHTPEYGRAISARLLGKKMSPERLEIHRRAMTGRNGGRHFTPEQRLEASLRNLGKKYSEEFKKRLSESQKKANEWRRKPIIQYDLRGNIVRRFNSVMDAEAIFGKRSNICGVCKGKRHTAFGYVWRYDNVGS